MSLPTTADMEKWAIDAARGDTKEKRELAASNLFAGGRAWMRHAAQLQHVMERKESALREFAGQFSNLADRIAAIDASKPVPDLTATLAVAARRREAASERSDKPLEVPAASDAKPATLVPGPLRMVPREGA